MSIRVPLLTGLAGLAVGFAGGLRQGRRRACADDFLRPCMSGLPKGHGGNETVPTWSRAVPDTLEAWLDSAVPPG